jgi:hypothetical protein
MPRPFRDETVVMTVPAMWDAPFSD